MEDGKQKLVVITGPTATGKSSLAVELALYFDGEIVNADSMQIYRGMDLGTAKPTEAEKKGIPHHLLNVVDPSEPFNAANYRFMAIPVLSEIISSKKMCFIVGGTGLYIKALLGGLLYCPPSDEKIRNELNKECEESGVNKLHEKLIKLDPECAEKIHPNDKVRVIRSLEIIQLTNERVSTLAENHNFGERPFDALKICLHMNREQLYHRINNRCINMIENGLERETRSLLNKYAVDLKPMQSIGYRHMINFISGHWSFDETLHRFQTDTRRYAKRQLTWFRSDPEMQWFLNDDKDAITKKIEEFMRN